MRPDEFWANESCRVLHLSCVADIVVRWQAEQESRKQVEHCLVRPGRDSSRTRRAVVLQGRRLDPSPLAPSMSVRELGRPLCRGENLLGKQSQRVRILDVQIKFVRFQRAIARSGRSTPSRKRPLRAPFAVAWKGLFQGCHAAGAVAVSSLSKGAAAKPAYPGGSQKVRTRGRDIRRSRKEQQCEAVRIMSAPRP